jgi:hypothetical protein
MTMKPSASPGDSVVKAFLSHSVQEADIALRLKELLDQDEIMVWAFEEDLPFGKQLREQVRSAIEESDHVLVILSDASHRSEWVAWELEVALRQRAKRGIAYPTIIGVLCDSPCRNLRFKVPEYRGSEAPDGVYDFGKYRCFKLGGQGRCDDIADLVAYLVPQVTVITDTEGERGKLLQDSFSCYEELFPDEGERDDPLDIETWIAEAARAAGASAGFPYREIYGVYHQAGEVLGIAYFTIYVDNRWCFGNYFGIRRGWRQKERARRFFDAVVERVRAISPGVDGIVFEVDPIDMDLLMEAAEAGHVRERPEQDSILASLRSLKRLRLYQTQGARAWLLPSGEPLPYWQPALAEPLAEHNERRLILMAWLFPGVSPEDMRLEEVLDFLYDRLYGDAYGGLGEVEIPGYRSYVASVRARVEQAARSGLRLGAIRLPREVSGLWRQAISEGLDNKLEL